MLEEGKCIILEGKTFTNGTASNLCDIGNQSCRHNFLIQKNIGEVLPLFRG